MTKENDPPPSYDSAVFGDTYQPQQSGYPQSSLPPYHAQNPIHQPVRTEVPRDSRRLQNGRNIVVSGNEEHVSSLATGETTFVSIGGRCVVLSENGQVIEKGAGITVESLDGKTVVRSKRNGPTVEIGDGITVHTAKGRTIHVPKRNRQQPTGDAITIDSLNGRSVRVSDRGELRVGPLVNLDDGITVQSVRGQTVNVSDYVEQSVGDTREDSNGDSVHQRPRVDLSDGITVETTSGRTVYVPDRTKEDQEDGITIKSMNGLGRTIIVPSRHQRESTGSGITIISSNGRSINVSNRSQGVVEMGDGCIVNTGDGGSMAINGNTNVTTHHVGRTVVTSTGAVTSEKSCVIQ